jgi:hypothetical protein
MAFSWNRSVLGMANSYRAWELHWVELGLDLELVLGPRNTKPYLSGRVLA